MTHNKFESKLLKQINSIDRIDEGIGSTILNLLFGRKFRKTLETAVKDEDDFPEYQAALHDLYSSYDRLEQSLARVQKGRKALEKANAAKAKKSKR